MTGKHKDTLLEWFYLDKDGNTVRRAKNGYRRRYKKDDIVKGYKLCSHGYLGVHIPLTRTTISYHHLVTFLRGIEIPEDKVVDHYNGNSCDNSVSNIRIVTQQINCRNSRKRSDNTSGITGISWNKVSNSFTVRKQLDGKRVYLGMRNTLSEAVTLLNSYRQVIENNGYTTRHGK